MLHGIHTLGVVGATRVLDGDYDSLRNFEAVEGHPKFKFDLLKPGFECFFDVGMMHGEVECPSLDSNRIFPLDEGREVTLNNTHKESEVKARSSILSAADLQQEILGLVAVAAQQTLPENRLALQDVRRRIADISSPRLEQMQAILDICRRNPRIPPESVTLIRNEVLS